MRPGTIIEAGHFERIYDWVDRQAAFSSWLSRSPNDYGLSFSEWIPFSMQLNGNRLHIHSMLGLCCDGTPILHHERYSPPLSLRLPEYPDTSDPLEIFIHAGGSRQPWGDISLPEYRLETRAVGSTVLERMPDNFIKLGILSFENGAYLLLDYIPPARHLGAEPNLWRKYEEIEKFWLDFLRLTPSICAQTFASSPNSERGALNRLAEAVGNYISFEHRRFQYLQQDSHPATLFELVAGLSHVFQFQLRTIRSSLQLNALLDTFQKYSHSTPGYIFQPQGFLDSVDALASHIYQHLDIEASLRVMKQFFRFTWPVWKRLGETDNITFTGIQMPNELG